MSDCSVYLTFNGNCREAFDFYRSVFGGDFDYITTFDELPESMREHQKTVIESCMFHFP